MVNMDNKNLILLCYPYIKERKTLASKSQGFLFVLSKFYSIYLYKRSIYCQIFHMEHKAGNMKQETIFFVSEWKTFLNPKS